MTRLYAVLKAMALLPALYGADAGRCRVAKNLYQERLVLAQKQGRSEGAAGSLLPAGSSPASGKLQALDEQYRQFLAELSESTARKDSDATIACCAEAAGDKAASLLCRLSTYLQSGRTDATTFLDSFPSNRREIVMLWDLNTLAGGAATSLYPPKGPSYKLLDELFLLVLDERDAAITKYFYVASHSGGDTAKYIHDQIRTFLKEAPSAVVNQWLVLRRYRPLLKTAAQALIATSSPAEMQTLVKAVHAFCDQANPDCEDILKLYGGK